MNNKVLIGVLLSLPILLLAVFTFKSNMIPSRDQGINSDSLKLTTSLDTSDEVARYIEDDDYETALVKISDELQDPNIPTSYGMPLLVLAAEKNNYEIADILIAKGADTNFADVNSGETALIKAAKNGNLNLMNLLVVSHADTNASSKRGVTPLTAAIETKNPSLTEFLMGRGARAGSTEENLLRYTFDKNNVGVDAMLKTGINPNFADKNGNTPLIVSASYGDFESVKSLLSYRADINASNQQGMTPLIYAIQAKRDEIVKYLIDKGADVNKANKSGETPLFWAAYYGNKELAHNLLILDADYTLTNDKGITPLKAAELARQTETAKVISDFIEYKNIPRDKKGNPIIPKEKPSQTTAKPATGAKKSTGTKKSSSTNTKKAAPKKSVKKEQPKTQVNALRTSSL